MKRKIEDYINKGDYAVLCSSIEEWNTIVDLINKNYVSTTTQPYSKTKSNVLNLQNLKVTIGTGILKTFPNYTIYPASDFLEKEFTFEKEKWYKNPGNFVGSKATWAKFEKWKNDKFYFTEWITNGVYENKKSHWCYSKLNKVYDALTDLTEIQQYLPLYHIDAQKYLP